MTKLKLEVGRYYRTRDGRKVGPMIQTPMTGIDNMQWNCVGGCGWTDAGTEFNCEDSMNDLIAEWTDTPVHPSPVQLRKVIVPGVYGKVSVGNWNGGGDFVPVKIVTELTRINGYKDIGHAIMSRADLISARDVFNALIDAMEE